MMTELKLTLSYDSQGLKLAEFMVLDFEVFTIWGYVSLCSPCSAVTMEFDDLSTKSREAENEVNMLQTRIQEINNNIYKHRKEMDCKYLIFIIL